MSETVAKQQQSWYAHHTFRMASRRAPHMSRYAMLFLLLAVPQLAHASDDHGLSAAVWLALAGVPADGETRRGARTAAQSTSRAR